MHDLNLLGPQLVLLIGAGLFLRSFSGLTFFTCRSGPIVSRLGPSSPVRFVTD